jgi:hypothetical protein
MAERAGSQPIKLTRRITGDSPVRFDPDTFALAGSYSDELAVFRARRGWREALERHLLLERDQDFTLAIVPDVGSERFYMRCEFVSMSGRSAFWRIIHHEAPEVQCLIETAHIPLTDSNFEALIAAPDMQPVDYPEPLVVPAPRTTVPRWLARTRARIAQGLMLLQKSFLRA